MTNTDEQHPICIMCDGSRNLQEHALTTTRHAEVHAERARKASLDIANLDIEGVFKKLHQLVEIVGGKSKHARQDNAQTALQMAAE